MFASRSTKALQTCCKASRLIRPKGKSWSRSSSSFRTALGDFSFSITQPYWSVREKKQRGSGGLLSITVNPYTCKGCMECVLV